MDAYHIALEEGNVSYLDTQAPYFDGGSGTIWEHIKKSIRFTTQNMGVHGFPLMLSSDWNDMLYKVCRKGKGESIWTGMQFAVALRMMQELAERKGEPEFVEECKALYARQQELCRTLAWDGAWFRRCITDEGRFIGSESEPQAKIWLNTQSWAVLSGLGTQEQQIQAMDSVKEYLDTDLGIKKIHPAMTTDYPTKEENLTCYNKGCGENGSVFCHANTWAIIAECMLRAGGRYIYDNANKYETLDRSGFGSAEDPVAASELLTGIDEIEIHWLTGDVYLVESDTDGVTFQEDYTGSNEDYRMRYKVSNGKLTIQPCKSKLFGSIDLPRKALTVFLPDTLTLDKITVETVSADVELMGGSVDTLSINTTSGNITGPGLSAKEYELGTVSGDISLTALPAGSSAIDCETVSGEVRISCTAHPDEIDFNSVSGNLRLTLPKGSCRYTLDFSTVSGDRDTDRFISGGDETCDITAETVSGNVELQTEP